jgi:hypothetical protein
MACLFSFRIVAAALCLGMFLYGSVQNVIANEQTYIPRSEEEVEVLSIVLTSEIKANNWTKSDLICFSVNGLDPSAKLVKSLRQRNFNVRSSAEWTRKFNCGFELQLEYTQFDLSRSIKVRSKVVDLREINNGEGDLALLLKDGEYSFQNVGGKWSISEYIVKPLASYPSNCGRTNEQSAGLALRSSPASIQTLAEEIRDKFGDEAETAIVRHFGAGRDVGSGLRILQWDVGAGVLTFSGGLASFQMNGGRVLWLTATSNKALQAVTGSGFEMTTPPSPQMKYWLGDLDLKTGSTYKFTDSREWESLHHREKQTNNFFLKHPEGLLAIRFAPECSPDTVLERLPEATVLCSLTFFPADGSPEAMFDIVVYPSERRLRFAREKPQLEFLMDKGW